MTWAYEYETVCPRSRKPFRFTTHSRRKRCDCCRIVWEIRRGGKGTWEIRKYPHGDWTTFTPTWKEDGAP